MRSGGGMTGRPRRSSAVLTPAHQIRVDDSFATFGGSHSRRERGGQRCVPILPMRRSSAIADKSSRSCTTHSSPGLHRIGRRVGQLRALRVFRDSTDLTASPDLWGKVTEAMDRSRYLIVVLSPHAAASKWVNKEVSYWLHHRGPDHLLFVVAGGSVAW